MRDAGKTIPPHLSLLTTIYIYIQDYVLVDFAYLFWERGPGSAHTLSRPGERERERERETTYEYIKKLIQTGSTWLEQKVCHPLE